MSELTPEEIFRKDQELAKKIADDILGDAPVSVDAVVATVSQVPDSATEAPEGDVVSIKNKKKGPSTRVAFGELTLGEGEEITTDSHHDEEAKRIQFGKVEDGVTPHPYQTREDADYKEVLKGARRELYATEKAAGLSPNENDPSEENNKDHTEDKMGFKKYSSVEEAVKMASKKLKKIEAIGDAEEIDFKEVPIDENLRPAPFIKSGIKIDDVEDVVLPESSQNTPDVSGLPVTGESESVLSRDESHVISEAGRINNPVNSEELKEWTIERLLGEIPDGSEFVLVSKTGKTKERYHRKGEKFLSIRDGLVTENVLAKLHKGWTFEMKTEENSQSAKQENKDLLKGRDPKDYSQIVPGDVWAYSIETDGEPISEKITIDSVSDSGFVIIHRQINGGDLKIDDVEVEDLREELQKKQYVLSHEATLEQIQPKPVSSQVSKPENPELLKGRDPKDYSQILPGDIWVLRTAKGQVLDRLQVNYTLKHGPEVGEIIQTSSSWEKSTDEGEAVPGFYPSGLEWRKNKFQDKLRSEEYVLEVAGEVPKREPRKKDIIDHLKEVDPYSRINGGDVWELRSPTGEQIERVYIEEVIEKKKRGKQEMWVEVEMEYSKTARIAKEKKQEQWQKFPLESFRKKLQDDGYVLITRGNGAELDYGGSFDWNAKLKEEKERYDPLGLPKKEDEWVRYTTASEEVEVSYDSVSNLYTVARVEDGGTIGTYTEGNIRRLAELENWEKIGGESERPKIEPSEPQKVKNPEQKPQESPLILPQGNEELYYRAANGSEFKVRKDAGQEGVYVLIAMATLQERGVSREELETLAEHNQWKQLEKPELVGPEPFSDQLIEKARAVVEETRGDFVRVESEQAGAMDRLKKYFSFLRKQDEINPEVRQCLEKYQNALVALQSLEIEKIKRSGVEGKELKQLIAGMIREYDFDEAERIDNAKRELRLNKEKEPFKKRIEQHFRDHVQYFDGKWPSQTRKERFGRDMTAFYIALMQTSAESVMSGVRTVGVGYNKLVSTKGGKITMMAAGGAAFGTAVLFSGGAAATMAGVLLAAKRAAAGAGFAVAAEGLTDYGAKVLRSRKADKKADEFFKDVSSKRVKARSEPGGSETVTLDFEHDSLERLEAYLRKDVNSKAYEKSVKRDRNHMYRKTGAVMAGVLFGNSSFVGNFFSEAQAATPTGSGSGMEKVAEAIEGKAPEVPKEAWVASPGGETGSNGANALLQERTVSSGDTITKYAVTSGETMGLEGEEGKRFAALLREKLNEKLAVMDPEVAKAAGFVPNKDGVLTADFIRADEKIHLGKILSSDEMKALAEQAQDKTVAPMVSPVEVSAPTSQAVLTETAKVLQEAGIAPTSAAPAVGETFAQPTPDAIAEFDAGKQKVTEYIKTLPQAEQVEVFRTMRGTMRDLFNTPEISIYGNYDMNYDLKEHPEMAKASMARVLEDHKTLSSRAFYMYDRSLNPLHWTQMQELAKFTEGAAKVLGKEVATPLKRESIEEYILRLALLAKESGKSFPGLHMVK